MTRIIIPTYKARATLPNALDSLVAQTKKLFMILIVQDDDGENYEDIIAEYRRRGLKIELLKLEKNGGPGVACQAGIDASGEFEYLIFMDSDDMLMPRAVEILHNTAKQNSADLVTSNFIRERPHQAPQVFEATKVPCTWRHGKIYRRQFLIENNIRYLDQLRLNEDAYFNLVVTNCTKKKFSINEITYLWRENPNSLTRKPARKDWVKDTWALYVESQSSGLAKIEEINGEVASGLLAATLINIYNEEMSALYYGNNLHMADKFHKQISELQSFKKAVEDVNFWQYIGTNVKGAAQEESVLIFYAKNFITWFKEFIDKK